MFLVRTRSMRIECTFGACVDAPLHKLRNTVDYKILVDDFNIDSIDYQTLLGMYVHITL